MRTNFHTGAASGIATKNGAGNYIFNGDEGCELTFKVSENEVDVSEKDCHYYHGARATLNGHYSKTYVEITFVHHSKIELSIKRFVQVDLMDAKRN